MHRNDAYDDFILSRKALGVAEGTLRLYGYTLRRFVDGLDVEDVADIHPKHVRAYLASVQGRPSYVWSHARNIRAFCRFLFDEGYIPEPIRFRMPPNPKDIDVLVLSADDVRRVVAAATSVRDRLIVLLLVDTGLRASEALGLDWEDITPQGIVVRNAKWGKTRRVMVGRTTAEALQRTYQNLSGPVIRSKTGGRLTVMGLRSVFAKLSRQSGVKVTPHSLRRTFATLSLRNGMGVLHLQGLLGHSTLEMTRRYARLVWDDLQAAHGAYGPVDHLF